MASASRRSARALKAYAVCAAVALLAGCGRMSALGPGSPHRTTVFGVVAVDPVPAVPQTPTAEVPDDFIVQRLAWSDRCASDPDPCGTTLTVKASGVWVLGSGDGRRSTGRLTHAEMVRLVNSVRVTQARLAAVPVARLSCPADTTSVVYKWHFAGVSSGVSTCASQPMPVEDLAREMDRVAKAVGR